MMESPLPIDSFLSLILRNRLILFAGLLLIGCSSPREEDPAGAATLSDDVVLPTKKQAETPTGVSEHPESVIQEGTGDLPLQFVGSSKCGECHQDQSESFFQTDHGHSLRIPGAGDKQTCEAWVHQPSQFALQSTLKDGVLHHLGWQMIGPAHDIAFPIADVPIRYVVGSGAFARSFLFQDNQALIQSPMALYSATGEYAMSAGYDQEHHLQYMRQVTDGCLFCHAGIVSRAGGNENHSTIHELSIGCERCHGQGARHSAEMEAWSQNDTKASHDATRWIIHPEKLDRQHSQDLCAQCHLQGNITLYAAGKDAWSYEPGTLVSDTKIEYSVGEQAGKTKFVGHFSQLQASVCYQKSETLTCITCHDPHHSENESEQHQVHREQCLACHGKGDCGVALDTRMQRNQDYCVECHMPRNGIGVPHVTVSNHRIAVHEEQESESEEKSTTAIQGPITAVDQLPEPVALIDSTRPGTWQRERNETAAVAQWIFLTSRDASIAQNVLESLIQRLEVTLDQTDDQTSSEATVVSRATAHLLIARLITAILRHQVKHDEPHTAAIKALRLRAYQHASRVVALEPEPSINHQKAVHVLARTSFKQGQFSKALQLYERLVRMRRLETDWYHLGLCQGRNRNFAGAERSFMRAIALRPSYRKPYLSLAKIYDTLDPTRAKLLRDLASQLP